MTEEAVLNNDRSHGQAARWTKWIGHLAGQPNLRFLEIGSYEGASAMWFLRNILTDISSRIVCVDTWTGGEDMKEFHDDELFNTFLKNTQELVWKIDIMRDRSDVALPTWYTHPDYFDVAYIDGSHTAANVLFDSVMVWRLVKVGGVVIWDDYLWELWNDPLRQPKMAVDAFLACYEGKYEVIAKEWQTAVRKLKA